MANFLSVSFASAILLLVAFFSITPTTHALCSQAMADSLSSSGFAFFAHAVRAYNLTASPRVTLLAPLDSAFVNRPVDVDFFPRHVSTVGALGYQTLLSLRPNTTLPTLDKNVSLLVVSDGHWVSFNEALVVVPNLYIDGSCAVHGIDGPLPPVTSPFDEMPELRREAEESLRAPARQMHQALALSRFVSRKIHLIPRDAENTV